MEVSSKPGSGELPAGPRADRGDQPTERPAPSPVPLPMSAELILAELPVVVVLVDGSGTVLWSNDLAESVGGYSADELAGMNMLDLVDSEWNARSLESIGYAMANPGRRLPATFRLLAKDGTYIIAEALANNQLDTPGLNALVCVLRVCEEQQLIDEMMEAAASGRPALETLRLVHPVGWCETLKSDIAIVLRPGVVQRDAGLSVLAPTSEVVDLMDGDPSDSPWGRAGATVTATHADVTDLPEGLRDRALQAGYGACYAFPVPRPSRVGSSHLSESDVAAVLVLWRREEGPPEPSVKMLSERLVHLIGLILERAETAAELTFAAHHDQLTGLFNRTAFFTGAEEALRDHPDGAGVLYLDLDSFKPVNDAHGHAAGDAVLQRIAHRLEAQARDGDIVGRLGGDEFAVVCPGAGIDELVKVAEVLLEDLSRPIRVGDHAHQVGVSIGLATAARGACSADHLVAMADAALIEGKACAKGTWRAAPPIT